jgi:hypothetical protein
VRLVKVLPGKLTPEIHKYRNSIPQAAAAISEQAYYIMQVRPNKPDVRVGDALVMSRGGVYYNKCAVVRFGDWKSFFADINDIKWALVTMKLEVVDEGDK